MPLLNDATAVYLGGTPAQAVYAGDVQVWPSGLFTDSVVLIAELFGSGAVAAGHVRDGGTTGLRMVGAHRSAADRQDQNGRDIYTFLTQDLVGASIAIRFDNGTITDPMLVTSVSDGSGYGNGALTVDQRAWAGYLPNREPVEIGRL